MANQRLINRVREVYFVQGFELKLIKIGVTNDTRRRMISMQTFSPDRLAVLGVQICLRSGALEDVLHRRFERYRQHGEWFSPAPELLAYIEANTVPLADAEIERERLLKDAALQERIDARIDRSKTRWMKANGFAHLVDEP